MLVANGQTGTRHVGRILAHPGQFPDEQAWAAAYLDGFTEVMRRAPTRRGHTNVLQHLAGYVSAPLDRDERAELVYAFEVRVPNPDGRLRIGMPGEVRFRPGRAR